MLARVGRGCGLFLNVAMTLKSGNVACFLPCFDKDLPAPLYFVCWPGGNFAFAITISVRLST